MQKACFNAVYVAKSLQSQLETEINVIESYGKADLVESSDRHIVLPRDQQTGGGHGANFASDCMPGSVLWTSGRNPALNMSGSIAQTDRNPGMLYRAVGIKQLCSYRPD